MAKYSTFKYGDGTKYGLSANPTGNVTWIMQIDWDGDGIFNGTNEAIYMTDLTIERGERHYITRSGNFEVPAEGTFTAMMDNSNGRYNPYNASSPIYPNVKPGRLVIIDVKDNDNNVTYRRFTGYILDIRPESDRDTVRIEGVDGWGRLKGAKVSVANAFLNRPLSQCITSMLFAANVPPGSWQINTDNQPVRVFYVDKADAGTVLYNLAQAGLGWFFFDRYNRPTFYPRNYAGMTTYNLDQAQSLRELFSSQPWDLISNYVTVIAHRIVKERIATIWSLADPIYLANGASATVTARYDPSTDFAADYDAWTNINGTGTQLKQNFAVILVGAAGTSQTTFTITNNSGSNGYLTELTISGRKLADRPMEYVAQDAASQATFGVRYFLHDTPYLQSRNYADSFADTIEAFLDDIQRELTVRIEQRPAYQYPLDLRDKVAFTSETLGIDATFSILGLRDEWQRATGQSVITTAYLSPVIYDNTSITPEPIDEEEPIPEVPPDPEDTGDTGGTGEDGDGEDPVPPAPGEAVAAVSMAGSIYVTADFGADSPAWVSKGFSGSCLQDFDISNDRNIAIAITSNKVYRCIDFLPTASATWTEVFDAATQMTGGSGGQVHRVHWSPVANNVVWVLASCEGSSADTSHAYMLKSVDSGVTWTQNLIAMDAGQREPFTVSTQTWELVRVAGTQVAGYSTHARQGDDESPTYNPWAIAFIFTRSGDLEVNYTHDDFGQDPPEEAYINQWGESDNPPSALPRVTWEASLTVGELATLDTFLASYFGGGEGVGWQQNIAPQQFDTNAQRVRTGHGSGNSGGDGTAIITDWVFWGKPDPGIPSAMDVAPNGTWLYVGGENAIYKSEDGGVNWFEIYGDLGAYDVHVDPQLSGVIYCWTSDGRLRQFQAGTTSTYTPHVYSGVVETPQEVPLRIAKHQNGGKIWITTGGFVDVYSLGTWTEQDTYTDIGRSLRSYIGGIEQRLIYVDGSTIQYSEDAGASWSDKTGDLSSLVNPVTIHLLE